MKTKQNIKFKSEKYFKESHVGVLLEDIQSNFRVFGESLSGLKEDVGGLKEDVSGLKEDVSGLKEEVRKLNEKVARIEIEITFIKEELVYLRKALTMKADVSRLEFLEIRVNKLETELAKVRK